MNKSPDQRRRAVVIAHACVLGVNRIVYRLAADGGYEVTIVVPSDHDAGIKPEPEEHPGITVVPLLRSGTGSRFYVYIGLEEVLEEVRPHLVHLDLEPDSRVAAQIASWTGPREIPFFVQTCENQGMWSTTCESVLPKRLVAQACRTFWLRSARKAIQHVFPISEDGASLLKEFGFGDRTTTMPLGVDLAVFRPDPALRAEVRAELLIPQGVPVVAYFGRILEVKGLHLLFEALEGLADLDWRLLVDQFDEVEGDPYLPRISRMLEGAPLCERVVRFEARHDEMPRYMNATDIAVLPSLRSGSFKEQYGRVVAESLACGTRMITSDVGALPEVGGGVAEVVPQNDVSSLREALRRNLTQSPEEVEKRSRAARAWAEEALGIDVQWARMKPIWDA